MAGLMEKDFRLIFRRKQTLVLFLAIAFMLGLNSGGSFVVGYLSCLCAIFTISTISYDEMDNGYSFLMTLPIDNKIYVYEKYLFCGIVGLLSWIAGVILSFAVSLVKGITIDPVEELMGALTMIPMFLLIGAFMIPLQLKFGAEKSRTVLMLVTGGILVVGFTFMNITDRLGWNMEARITRLDEMPYGVILGSITIATVILVMISIICSIAIMKKKEY